MMNKGKESSASSSGSPICTRERVSALHRRLSRRSQASAAVITYDQWKALGVEGAVKYLADYFNFNEDRQKKLTLILRREWGEPPKPANGADERPAPARKG